MKSIIVITLIICGLFSKIKGQETNEVPYFGGKKITASIINSISIVLDSAKVGDYLDFKVDNYAAIDNDLKAWSMITGNKVELTNTSTYFKTYRVIKTTAGSIEKSFAIILSNEGTEELLSPLGFAWAAALSGMDVSIYFQGPAVKVLEKGFKDRRSGLNALFSGATHRRLAGTGYISPREKIAELNRLGVVFYVCQPSLDHHRLKAKELMFDDIILSEYLTFMQVVSGSDIKFYL